jgi:hypothetical protein
MTNEYVAPRDCEYKGEKHEMVVTGPTVDGKTPMRCPKCGAIGWIEVFGGGGGHEPD